MFWRCIAPWSRRERSTWSRLAAENAATVTSNATVCVHDILRPVEAGVTHGAADNEASVD